MASNCIYALSSYQQTWKKKFLSGNRFHNIDLIWMIISLKFLITLYLRYDINADNI